MNSITIELCAEDRARLDRLAEALERRACEKCVSTALAFVGQERPAEPDPIQQKLAETLAKASEPVEAPKNAPVPAEETGAPDTHPAEEDMPWGEPAAPAKPVSLEEFQKALTLRCAESETTKAKVRELLHEYAPAASRVPEDKRAEVLDRLAKL